MTQMKSPPIVLTIAGSDSCGGAGIQADLKTFSALGTYGASVITALTAQNTRGVSAIHRVPGEFITQQMEAVFSDLDIRAVKIGMVGSAQAVGAIAEGLRRWCRVPVVLDPVMVATSGDALLEPEAEVILIQELVGLADIVTPNIREVARLLGEGVARNEDELESQARAIAALGAKAVLVTGGEGSGAKAVDFFYDGEDFRGLSVARVATKNTHGTGCTLSSAIAANLAHGFELVEAVRGAKAYITQALVYADMLDIGEGAGPVNHFWAAWGFESDEV